MFSRLRPLLVLLVLISVPSDAAWDAYLNLRLTQTLFQGVLASHYDAMEAEEYTPTYYADRAYLRTFTNSWSQMVESGKYSSTKEIFAAIKKHDGYLAKSYTKWESITDSRASGKAQFLNQVLDSETRFPNLEARIRHILDMANLYLVTNDQEYQLAATIAVSFTKSENEKIRIEAEGILSSIPVQKKIQVVLFGANVVEAVFGGGYAALKVLKSFFHMPRLLQAMGKSLAALTRKQIRFVNPILRRMTAVEWGWTTSAVVHGGAVGALFLGEEKTNSNSATTNNHSSLMTIGNLYDSFQATYQDSFLVEDFSDFNIRKSGMSKEELLGKVKSHLENHTPLDYGDVFLAAEKILKVDGRAPNDRFAMDFAYHRYEVLKLKTAQIFAMPDISGDERIEFFRAMVIEDVLYNYKGEFPGLFPALMGWGGNCVAQTMLITALLEPYRDYLPGRLVITVWLGHVEAALQDGNRVSVLAHGFEFDNPPATLHPPEFLMQRVLRQFSGAIMSNKPEQRSGMANYSLPQDIKDGTEEFPDGAAPYAATLNYSKMSKRIAGEGGTTRYSKVRERRKGKAGEARVKPIALQFDKSPPWFKKRTFSYDKDNRNLVVFNQDRYADFMRFRQLVRGNPERLETYIKSQELRELLTLLKHPVIEGFYRSAQNKDFRRLTDDDLDAHDLITEEAAVTAFGLSETNLTRFSPGSFNTLLANSPEANIPEVGEMRQALMAMARDEEELVQNVIANPREFLELYDGASRKLRRHLLSRVFGAKFWEYNAADGYNQWQYNAKVKMRAYLGRMTDVKVVFSKETDWVCSKVKVDLPKVGNWTFIEKPGLPCGEASDQKNQDVSTFEDPKKAPSARTDLLQLKISTLIELTVGFGAGLHLWNEAAVDAFMHGRYDNIEWSRPTSLQIIRSIYDSNSTLQRDPKFKKLSELPQVPRPR